MPDTSALREAVAGDYLVRLDGRALPPGMAPARPRTGYRLLACLLLTLALTGGALAWAMRQPVRYEATDRLLVGGTDPRPQAIGGFAIFSRQQLASTYARLVGGRDFDHRVIGLAHAPAHSFVSVAGTPQPQSPFVRLTVRATTPAAAKQYLTAAEQVLIQRVRTFTDADAQAAALKQASSDRQALANSERRTASGPSSGPTFAANTARTSTARLKANASAAALKTLTTVTPSAVQLSFPTGGSSPRVSSVARRSWVPAATLGGASAGVVLSALILLMPTALRETRRSA
jgi:hypothetical protein